MRNPPPQPKYSLRHSVDTIYINYNCSQIFPIIYLIRMPEIYRLLLLNYLSNFFLF